MCPSEAVDKNVNIYTKSVHSGDMTKPTEIERIVGY
jgi:hypothetical protein